MQLSFYVCDVVCSCNAGMDIIFDSKVFSRQTECVPAHGMQYLITLQYFISADYVTENVTSPVAYMQTCTGRIREHIQAVKFRFYIIFFVDGILFPFSTPFFFNFSKIITLIHFEFLLRVTVWALLKKNPSISLETKGHSVLPL